MVLQNQNGDKFILAGYVKSDSQGQFKQSESSSPAQTSNVSLLIGSTVIYGTLTSPVSSRWKIGNYSIESVMLDYGTAFLRRVSYMADGTVQYDPPSNLGASTHALFHGQVVLELVQDLKNSIVTGDGGAVPVITSA